MAEQRDNRKRINNREDDGINSKLIAVNRVTKVVKGGRNMRFSALVVVGDGAGKVGLGMGKAAEVPEAIEKATQLAKRNMATIALKDGTIPHQTTGKFGRGQVLLLPAETGTGVIAGGAVRAVLEAAGVKDIRTKSLGSNNPINCAKATLEGLCSLRNAELIAKLRGVDVEG
ncbi:MAG: 30S ribosomal protein S5 [Clostridia bacterium]|nr:30S ribosomal protein S5 [Clostridia bacterium]MBO5777076.1 30S ribosomal protein S5 [Clostridia bacterium]MBO5982475.1 30S ribosomal protein S5 [Clostridia bacterium]MBO7221554.1 30S ribosomal protein S5 [Clostridia bacterium]MBO7326298.1 30S ribosomal protein S5 [Clostridia bacterium]